jgi:outer membrane protein TolC
MNKFSMFFFLFAGFISIFLGFPSLAAQEARVLTCEEAVDIALGRSYTVKSYQAKKTSMQHYFDYYKAQFKPRLDFSMYTPSLAESVSPIERADGLPVYNSTGILRAGSDLKFTYMLPSGGNLALSSQLYHENLKTVLAMQNYQTLTTKNAFSSLNLSFSQPIFTANTLRENLDEAGYRYALVSSQFTRQQMDIIYRVTAGFYSLYRASREVEIAREKLKNSDEAYRIAKLKNETGRIPEGDVLIAEVEMSRNRAALLESEGNLEREKDDFSQLIGLDPEEKIRIVTEVKYDTLTVNTDKAVEEALKNRLELAEADMDLSLQGIAVSRASREREFKGTITAYYDITGVSTVGAGSPAELFRSSFGNFIDRPPNRGITLTFSYPVSDWGRGAARVQQEEMTLKEKKLSKENTRRTLVREVKDVVRQVGEAQNRLAIHEKNQQVAQRSYEISRMRFENGDIASQDLAREQERLAAAQLDYLNAFIAYQLATADLKRKTMWDFKNNRSYRIDGDFQK